MNNKYFFCYSDLLHLFIQKKYKIKFICTGLHEKTHKQFWLYEKTDQLQEALEHYKVVTGTK